MAQRDRQRRYRARVRSGEAVYPVAADDTLLLALIAAGRLSEADSADRGRVADEIAAVLRDWSARWV